MSLTRSPAPDRSHIAKANVKRWAKHFRVSLDILEAAIGKVGTSVEAVEHELILRQQKQASSGAADATTGQRRKGPKPMDVQPSDEQPSATPMGSTPKTRKRSLAASAVSKRSASASREGSLAKQRAAQKRSTADAG